MSSGGCFFTSCHFDLGKVSQLLSESETNLYSKLRFVKTSKVLGRQDVLGDEMLRIDKNRGKFTGSSLQIIFTFAIPKKLDSVQ